MNKEAIIFDLDGTLWETIDSTYVSLNSASKKHNINKKITRKMKKYQVLVII